MIKQYNRYIVALFALCATTQLTATQTGNLSLFKSSDCGIQLFRPPLAPPTLGGEKITTAGTGSIAADNIAADNIAADNIAADCIAAGCFAADSIAADCITADSIACDTIVRQLPWPACMTARLDTLMQEPLLKKTQLGLLVYDLTADSTLYEQGSRQTLRPASTLKLVTAITALDRLGRDYNFRTSIYYKGEIRDSALLGDLWIVGGMDPATDSEDLRVLSERIASLGIDTIRGRIMTDLTMKDETRLGEGWCWDDDNPVLSPLLIERKDEFAQRLARGLQGRGIAIVCPDSQTNDNKESNVNHPTNDVQPTNANQQADSSRMQAIAIAEGTLPKGATLIAQRFHPMPDILTKMMKESDNLYAEAMLYQIAASGGQKRATAKHAQTHEKRLITRVGLNPGDYRLADGSGLSLYNYVSPELLVRLLRMAWQDRQMFDALYPTLPIAGVDGTLKERMKKTRAEGNVHAKTGTLSGISSLAGYCTAANGHLLAFCIINQGVMRNQSGRAFQDKVCEAMCK